VPVLVRRILKGRAKRRWLQCRVLVIDEISMISGDLFTKVEAVARAVRKDDRPFGGIQIIICGDFVSLAARTHDLSCIPFSPPTCRPPCCFFRALGL